MEVSSLYGFIGFILAVGLLYEIIHLRKRVKKLEEPIKQKESIRKLQNKAEIDELLNKSKG